MKGPWIGVSQKEAVSLIVSEKHLDQPKECPDTVYQLMKKVIILHKNTQQVKTVFFIIFFLVLE